MLIVSFLTFAAFSLISGDTATAMLGTSATPERLAALRAELGLDRPLLVRHGGKEQIHRRPGEVLLPVGKLPRHEPLQPHAEDPGQQNLCDPRPGADAGDLYRGPGLSGGPGHCGDPGLLGGARSFPREMAVRT